MHHNHEQLCHDYRQHGWFTVKLPRYLAVQADGMATAMHLDEDIVREVGKLGFPRAQLLQSLRRREQVRWMDCRWRCFL